MSVPSTLVSPVHHRGSRPIRSIETVDAVLLTHIIQLRLALDGRLTGDNPRIYMHEGKVVRLTRMEFDVEADHWILRLHPDDETGNYYTYVPTVTMTKQLRNVTTKYLIRKANHR